MKSKGFYCLMIFSCVTFIKAVTGRQWSRGEAVLLFSLIFINQPVIRSVPHKLKLLKKKQDTKTRFKIVKCARCKLGKPGRRWLVSIPSLPHLVRDHRRAPELAKRLSNYKAGRNRGELNAQIKKSEKAANTLRPSSQFLPR